MVVKAFYKLLNTQVSVMVMVFANIIIVEELRNSARSSSTKALWDRHCERGTGLSASQAFR